MKSIKEGNLYNVEQAVTGKYKDVSKVGLDQWKAEVRKQIMEKLRGYSPEHVEKIIKATFGHGSEIF
jgi:SOS response regulatory protein OraA/RecX